MMNKELNETRKNSTPIKVYCLRSEKENIESQARKAGMSVAKYLREVGQGYRITGIVDYECVRELAKINSDLGRLGGLLKLWLTNNIKTKNISSVTIRAVLNKIESNQNEIGRIMKDIVMRK
ncbi:TPA: conjugal transfer transcriptional regulator TraJ [Proteus mirabilis]|nr:conjugal transfer transcriptional regulator TraJ [Proteus mirabilis]HCD1091615.1 conjugal transfer transcriptional regulator TraJ [Proteus mirabilis]HEK1029499.1 conjugal transfer transcriptional regulator TraJ [Proteus mirabilis]